MGLDHVSFAVDGRADLERTVRHLDELGLPHEGIKDIGAGYILEFRDPDDSALDAGLFVGAEREVESHREPEDRVVESARALNIGDGETHMGVSTGLNIRDLMLHPSKGQD